MIRGVNLHVAEGELVRAQDEAPSGAPNEETVRELAAANEGVSYLDSGGLLDEVGQNAFIDDCHLTILGHRALSRAMRDRLYELGWIPEAD